MLVKTRGAALRRLVAAALVATLLTTGCGTAGSTPAARSEQAPAAERATSLPKVEFPSSVVHELPSASGRRYQVWVDLPASHPTSDKPLPVVFVTDPNFAFAITRNIRSFTGQRGRNIEEFILVGLVHDPAVTPGDSRSRDYTPTVPRRAADGGNSYNAKAYGEAEAYRQYVETKVFPLIAGTYRADMNRKTFIGHSYGSLFGLYAMFTRPGMFENYVLGSPSLWFDGGAIERLEAAYAAKHRELKANVHMVAGSFEQPGPTPRHYKVNDLVGDMRRFERRLKGRGYAGLTVRSEVADGEDHYSVFHDVASRGLIALLPGIGPYTSG
jgi:hypothetical protein